MDVGQTKNIKNSWMLCVCTVEIGNKFKIMLAQDQELN
jgi:hypothetical protein